MRATLHFFGHNDSNNGRRLCKYSIVINRCDVVPSSNSVITIQMLKKLKLLFSIHLF